MNHILDTFQSSLMSYFAALWGMVSSSEFVAGLGGLLLVVRLIYDTTRLIRYLRDPQANTPDQAMEKA